MSNLDSWGRPKEPDTVVDLREDPGTLRSYAIERLRRIHGSVTGSGASVKELRPSTIRGDFRYATEANVAFTSVLWDLVYEGIIVPGAPAGAFDGYNASHAFGFPTFTVTPYGRSFLSSVGVIHPRDIDGYMSEAKARAHSDADPTLFTYLSEALHAFNRRLYLSSAVMLGVSAELLALWLIGRFIDSLPEPDKANQAKQYEKLKFQTSSLFKHFAGAIESRLASRGASRDLVHRAGTQLELATALIRQNRDEAGHGRPTRIDEQNLSGQLQSYLALISLVTEIADAL